MKTVGAFEGKTHFSALIDEAARGETIIITKKGKPVAQIGPVASQKDQITPEQAIRDLFSIKGIRGPVNVRELIEEGRRY
ncbi:MAG TPA: type II toxin-antitoxin system prevent-host-death family antitoxin [Candidatus Baltobacteraceae bacterium]|jgi:prevent-host-death family protein|nr:type II toxin-antitoxin system prevent-host-death family antitoxin [Candidatus Baltobacteraceae bacterium]